MTSDKVKIDKVNKNERTFDKSKDKICTELRDKIITSIEVTRRSKVPTLFFSNPGFGKTTTICSYARMQGMHVEELIGSQYSQDEILGFQSRTDKPYLEVLEPEWYHRIITYAQPHYEKKSSGTNFTLVEEDDVNRWTELLPEYAQKVKDTTLVVEDLEKELAYPNISADDKIIKETVLKSKKMELERFTYNRDKYKAWLEDVEWRGPRTSILFLDEMSTASPNVQGAILNLCFNRKIRGNKELPKDCIILSAANYKANLSGFHDIISPQLNRFCIVNILPGNKNSNPDIAAYEELGFKLVDEFLQDFKEVDLELPEFRTDFQFNDTTNELFLEDLRNELKKVIRKYTGKDSSRAMLDFRNISFDGMYDRDDDIPEVYNFMSPRTMSYYARIVRAMCEMGILASNRSVYEPFVDGIFGLGTNNWDTNETEAFHACITDFHQALYDMTSTLLNKYRKNFDSKKVGEERQIRKDSAFMDTKTITGKVKNIVALHDRNEYDLGDKLTEEVTIQFDNEFCKNTESPVLFKNQLIEVCSDPKNVVSVKSDLESLKQFVEILEKLSKDDGYTPLKKGIKEELNNWAFYYTELSNLVLEDEKPLTA